METENKHNLDWNAVEKALNDGSSSGYKIAVIETDKILAQALKDKNYQGEDIEENLEIAKNIFTDYEKLEYARAMREKIISEQNFEVSREDTKEIIASYYQAISDLMESKSKIKLGQKTVSKIKKSVSSPSSIIKKTAIGIFLFFLTVLILSDTQIGHSITEFLSASARFIFYKLLVIVAIAAGIIVIIIGTISFFENRKENKKMKFGD
jgi:hypothetical protein